VANALIRNGYAKHILDQCDLSDRLYLTYMLYGIERRMEGIEALLILGIVIKSSRLLTIAFNEGSNPDISDDYLSHTPYRLGLSLIGKSRHEDASWIFEWALSTPYCVNETRKEALVVSLIKCCIQLRKFERALAAPPQLAFMASLSESSIELSNLLIEKSFHSLDLSFAIRNGYNIAILPLISLPFDISTLSVLVSEWRFYNSNSRYIVSSDGPRNCDFRHCIAKCLTNVLDSSWNLILNGFLQHYYHVEKRKDQRSRLIEDGHCRGAIIFNDRRRKNQDKLSTREVDFGQRWLSQSEHNSTAHREVARINKGKFKIQVDKMRDRLTKMQHLIAEAMLIIIK
jgi:hypothetical protein